MTFLDRWHFVPRRRRSVSRLLTKLRRALPGLDSDRTSAKLSHPGMSAGFVQCNTRPTLISFS
jgi:hypothetical protein